MLPLVSALASLVILERTYSYHHVASTPWEHTFRSFWRYFSYQSCPEDLFYSVRRNDNIIDGCDLRMYPIDSGVSGYHFLN